MRTPSHNAATYYAAELMHIQCLKPPPASTLNPPRDDIHADYTVASTYQSLDESINLFTMDSICPALCSRVSNDTFGNVTKGDTKGKLLIAISPLCLLQLQSLCLLHSCCRFCRCLLLSRISRFVCFIPCLLLSRLSPCACLCLLQILSFCLLHSLYLQQLQSSSPVASF